MTTERVFNELRTEQIRTQTFGFVMAAIICCAFAVVFTASCIARLSGNSDIIIDDRINPNKAPSASLVRLPNIGPNRAAAIIEYRRQKNDSIAFETAADLQNIKGIGPKTVESIRPWLCFE